MSSGEIYTEEEVLLQASANRDAGRLDDAAQLYRLVLKKNPQNAEAQKGLHAIQKKSRKPSRKGGKKPARKNRGGGDAKSAKARSPSGQRSAPPRIGPQPQPDDIQSLWALYTSGHLAEAEAQARRLIKKFPTSYVSFAILGAALADQGHLERAIASYRRALKFRPDYSDALNNLGNAHHALGQNEDAVDCFRRAIKIAPDHAQAHNNLGNTLVAMGRFKEAVPCFHEALRIKPEFEIALVSFAEAARRIDGLNPTAETRDLLIRCFESPAVESNAVNLASQSLLNDDLEAVRVSGVVPGDKLPDLDALTGGLLSAHLRSALITDAGLEALLTGVRSHLLSQRKSSASGKSGEEEPISLLYAIASQCFLNEFVWSVSDEEHELLDKVESDITASLRNGSAVVALDFALLAAYRPVHAMKKVAGWAKSAVLQAPDALKNLLKLVVLEPLREAETSQNIEALTSIDDTISQAVQAQYEENPYPRWDSVSAGMPFVYTEQIRREIAHPAARLTPLVQSPKVLIAGCGTGKQAIMSASILRQSELLAVDLSKASLAYAIRKAEDLGIRNIRFAQADILKLGQSPERFDVIECGGVLHHMAEPEAGLKVLLGLLNPGGFIKLGLYSELARQDVVRVRDIIAEMNFEPTLEGIRAFREYVRSSNLPEAARIQSSRDFYATSLLRDLAFHVQECRFTLPEIGDLLGRLDLEFLGFQLPNAQIRGVYGERFPSDPEGLDLQNWHAFEQDNPDIFSGMYQFWCRSRT